MNDVLEVKDLELEDVPGVRQAFTMGLRAAEAMIDDMEEGKLDKPKLRLSLEIIYEPTRDGALNVSAVASIKTPKYAHPEVYAQRRLGRWRFMPASQAELPGIRAIRTGRTAEEK